MNSSQYINLFANETKDDKPWIPTTHNYTKDQIDAIFYLIWVGYPLLLACCSIGNVINLIVLTHESRKGSTNVYMTTVAICDLFILWLYMPVYLYNVSPTLRRHNPAFKTAFLEFYGLQNWGFDTCIHLCDWTLLTFSLERLLAILRPFSLRNLKTVKSARITSLVLLFIAGLFTFHHLVQRYWNYVNGNKSPAWLLRWNRIQNQAEVVNTIFKFFALLIINCIIVAVLVRVQRTAIGKMRSKQDSGTTRKFKSSYILLLGSAALYCVTQFPALVVNFMYLAADEHHTLNFQKSTRQFVSPLTNIFFLLNYSVNFFLYLTVSKRFRLQLVAVFNKYFCKKKFLLSLQLPGTIRERTNRAAAIEDSTETSTSGSDQTITAKNPLPAKSGNSLTDPAPMVLRTADTEIFEL